MDLLLYIMIVIFSPFLFHVFFLRANIVATVKSQYLTRPAGGGCCFELNESAPLVVAKNIRLYPVMLLMFAVIILGLHYVSYYYTGIPPSRHFINPFLDGLALFLFYNFFLLTGMKQPLLTSIYIDKDRVTYSDAFGAVSFERSYAKVYFRKVSDGLFHCVLQQEGYSKSLFVSQRSLELLSLWATHEKSERIATRDL